MRALASFQIDDMMHHAVMITSNGDGEGQTTQRLDARQPILWMKEKQMDGTIVRKVRLRMSTDG